MNKTLGDSSADNIDKIALKAITQIEFLSGKDLVQNRRIILNYSGHFSNYNANVRYSKIMMQFSLSRLWKNVDEEIQIGLVQSLVVRMGKLRNINTSEMKLYESFIKGLSKYARKHIYDPQLEESFNRVNDALHQVVGLSHGRARRFDCDGLRLQALLECQEIF